MIEPTLPPVLYWSPSLGQVIHHWDLTGPDADQARRDNWAEYHYWSIDRQDWDDLRKLPDDAVALVAGEPYYSDAAVDPLADAVRRFDRAAQDMADMGAHTVCQRCGDTGIIAAGGQGPDVYDEHPCPAGCAVPDWLVAERADAARDAGGVTRLRARLAKVEELGGQAIRAEARAVTDLEAELVEVRSRCDRVLALHAPDDQGNCPACGFDAAWQMSVPWPCPTFVALGGAQ